MNHRRATLAAALALGMCLSPAGQSFADQWILGGSSGIPWAQVAKSTAQIDSQTAPMAIQMRGFFPDQNILTSLNWSYGRPGDFISEGDAALWDNTALRDKISLTIVDGDSTTSTENLFKRAGIDQSGRVFFLDLGSRIPAERLSFFPRPEGTDANGRPYSNDFVRRYEVQIADGQSYVAGQPLYQLLRDVPVNPTSVATLIFPSQFIRFLRLRVGSRSPFEIAEVELFGDGFVPRATYESQVVNLGAVSNYGTISWSQRHLERVEGELRPVDDPETSVTIRMKTGLDDTPLTFYERVVDSETRVVSFNEITEREFGVLQQSSSRFENDSENWSDWSLPLVSGQQISLPSPRPFFQLRILLEGTSVSQTAHVESLVVESFAPPADAVFGEISIEGEPDPQHSIAQVNGGETARFAYDVSARVNAGQSGFDALRIETPTRPRFLDLLMGNPLVSIAPDDVSETDSSLTVEFSSARIEATNNVPFRVVFEGSVVVFGTVFSGRVWDSTSELLGQPVLEGDANRDVLTNTLRVALTERSVGDILRNVAVVPAVFTPNGDGINDESRVEFTVTQISNPRALTVLILDLSGRRVRSLVQENRVGGVFSEVWDGTDDHGGTVPPGTYLASVDIHTATGSFHTTKTVRVAY
ncbi:MAG: FlgD immunoglobulin-like domain containing protein [Dehalococcoidia bacterium]|nr:FlgD immunoglobulin-like domain containing protein [Dehalococcoidia bacterium]